MGRGNKESRTIDSVMPDRIAEEIGVVPGDILLSINDLEVADVFDYRMREIGEFLTLEFEHADGTRSKVTVEKDEGEELGLVFAESLLDRPKACSNHCLFCFLDQLPRGMRPTLYFKDDDLRLCFLNGNFVTLTNIDDEEFSRLLSYRLSPLNISVHATDPKLRERMMGNRFAGNVMERLQKAVSEGIGINCQIVLCPGINDGAALDRSVTDLVGLGENLLSIAVVPVGLTRFREENGLTGLRPYDAESAGTVIDHVHRRQSEFRKKYGRRILYAADEFYIRAGRPIPTAGKYDDFYQLENGVGLLAARRSELREATRRLKRSKTFSKKYPSGLTQAGDYLLISGTDAASFVRDELERARAVMGSVPEVLAVSNRFFGENVTVTGLLTGEDILFAVKNRIARDDPSRANAEGFRAVLLPDVTLRDGEDVFLDDMTVGELCDQIGLPVVVYETTGFGLTDALVELEEERFSGKRGDTGVSDTEREDPAAGSEGGKTI
ncbi:MAG: DUF512 domain-containing protein [Clostridiales bacterium]|nr:DUF512 domain-containing protein [Clostridiales bacterium]